eukprot:SAG11_NODE_15976_length_560_cov_8.427332_1_plen_179_part_10
MLRHCKCFCCKPRQDDGPARFEKVRVGYKRVNHKRETQQRRRHCCNARRAGVRLQDERKKFRYSARYRRIPADLTILRYSEHLAASRCVRSNASNNADKEVSDHQCRKKSKCHAAWIGRPWRESWLQPSEEAYACPVLFVYSFCSCSTAHTLHSTYECPWPCLASRNVVPSVHTFGSNL